MLLRAVIDQIVLTWRLLRDPRVPLWAKFLPFLGVIYILSPLDFIPDIFIGLGQLDDLGIFLAGLRLFEAAIPEYIVNEHRLGVARRHKPLEVVDAPRYHISHRDETE